jgi:hypothetical protein
MIQSSFNHYLNLDWDNFSVTKVNDEKGVSNN